MKIVTSSSREASIKPTHQGLHVSSGPGTSPFALQRIVGNYAMHELAHVVQQGAGNLRLQRQTEAAPGTEPASSESELAQQPEAESFTSSATGASLLGLPSLSLPAPCTPAVSLLQAQILHGFARRSFLPYASAMFGPVTASLWGSYLDDTAGIPRAARAFAGSGEIPDGFTKHHKSAEAETEVVNAAATVLGAPGSSIPLPAPGVTAAVPLTSIVPAATLNARINTKSDPMGLDFDSPASTIPGNIAGGIGSGGPPGNTTSDPDTRDVGGMLNLTMDPAGTTITVSPGLEFHVHDTIDFCPGALGGPAARAETVPMSILEATEGRFGPVFAADVPFDVEYPGPGKATRAVTLPAPAPTPPAPVPPAPAPPSPGPPSASMTYTVVKDDSLWKIAKALCGDPLKWKDIYAANAAIIGPDPNLIYAGQVLTIPCAPP